MIQNESLNKAKTLGTIFHLPIPPPILFVYLFVCYQIKTNYGVIPLCYRKIQRDRNRKTETSDDLVYRSYEVSDKIIGWLALL